MQIKKLRRRENKQNWVKLDLLTPLFSCPLLFSPLLVLSSLSLQIISFHYSSFIFSRLTSFPLLFKHTLVSSPHLSPHSLAFSYLLSSPRPSHPASSSNLMSILLRFSFFVSSHCPRSLVSSLLLSPHLLPSSPFFLLFSPLLSSSFRFCPSR